MGFPLLECSLGGGKESLTVTQRWFLADGSAPDGRTWAVPLFLSASTDTAGSAPVVVAPAGGLFLEAVSATLPTASKAFTWLKVNARGGHGRSTRTLANTRLRESQRRRVQAVLGGEGGGRFTAYINTNKGVVVLYYPRVLLPPNTQL